MTELKVAACSTRKIDPQVLTISQADELRANYRDPVLGLIFLVLAEQRFYGA
jgi:hypothetical protein